MVSDEGEELGQISDVLQTGANDVYVISKEGEPDLLVPAIKECIKQVDIELCAILGKDETLKRVQDGINRLS